MGISDRLRTLWGNKANAGERFIREQAQNADIIFNKRVAFEMNLGGARLPEISKLGDFERLFIKVDGIAFHDGKKETLINVAHATKEIAGQRAEKIATWSERDGTIAIVDAKGEMYMARAHYLGDDQRMHAVANVLEDHGFARADWPVPVGAKDVAVGRIDYSHYVRQKAQLDVHRDIQNHLGRPSYNRPGQLERFMKDAEAPPGAPKRPVTIDGANIFANM